MGEKAKWRRAMDAALAQYGKELSKLDSLNDPGTIQTNSYRSATEAVGDSLNGQDRRNLKKADQLARKINNDDAYKQGIEKYNDRLKILQDQMKGKGSERYFINDKPTLPSPEKTSSSITGMAGNKSPQPGGVGMLAALTMAAPKDISYDQTKEYFSSRDDALAKAEIMAQEYNANNASKSKGLITSANSKPYQATAADFLGTQVFDPATTAKGGDRSIRMSRLDAAAKDMQNLSGAISKTTGEAAASQYSTIADKINQRLTKVSNDNVGTQQAGLIDSTLANELNNGVIR